MHQFRERLVELFTDTADDHADCRWSRFGFKHGVPLDADTVFDCRFLPNPHWVERAAPADRPGRAGPALRARPGGDRRSSSTGSTTCWLPVLPAYVKEGKSYLTIAVGCTGGRHRSVVVAEELARRIERRGYHPIVHHRDIDALMDADDGDGGPRGSSALGGGHGLAASLAGGAALRLRT